MKYVFMMMMGLCLFAVGCDDTDDYPPGDQNIEANDDQDDGANDGQDDGAAGNSRGVPRVYSTPRVD